MEISNHCTVLIFSSEKTISLKLNKLLGFGGKRWKIKSFITAEDCFFATIEGFVKSSDTSSSINRDGKIESIRLAVYELLIEVPECNEDLFIYSGRNDNDILYECSPGRGKRKDRHKPSALRRLDRHKHKEDRHKHKEDRHKHKDDRHNILVDLQSDTGMERCCAICFL